MFRNPLTRVLTMLLLLAGTLTACGNPPSNPPTGDPAGSSSTTPNDETPKDPDDELKPLGNKCESVGFIEGDSCEANDEKKLKCTKYPNNGGKWLCTNECWFEDGSIKGACPSGFRCKTDVELNLTSKPGFCAPNECAGLEDTSTCGSGKKCTQGASQLVTNLYRMGQPFEHVPFACYNGGTVADGEECADHNDCSPNSLCLLGPSVPPLPPLPEGASNAQRVEQRLRQKGVCQRVCGGSGNLECASDEICVGKEVYPREFSRLYGKLPSTLGLCLKKDRKEDSGCDPTQSGSCADPKLKCQAVDSHSGVCVPAGPVQPWTEASVKAGNVPQECSKEALCGEGYTCTLIENGRSFCLPSCSPPSREYPDGLPGLGCKDGFTCMEAPDIETSFAGSSGVCVEECSNVGEKPDKTKELTCRFTESYGPIVLPLLPGKKNDVAIGEVCTPGTKELECEKSKDPAAVNYCEPQSDGSFKCAMRDNASAHCTLSKDACTDKKYCNEITKKCEDRKDNDASCFADNECKDASFCALGQKACKEVKNTNFCEDNKECPDTHFCDLKEDSDTLNMCVPKLAADKECTEDFECKGFCTKEKKCADNKLAKDGACDRDAQCATGLFCHEKKCADLVATGGKCKLHGECASGNFCDSEEKKCKAVINDDTTACRNNLECAPGRFCTAKSTKEKDKKVCRMRHTEGQPCLGDSCADGLFCNDKNVCQQKLSAGTECKDDNQCGNNAVCAKPLACKAKVADAHKCDSDEMCGDNSFCYSPPKACASLGGDTTDCSTDSECQNTHYCSPLTQQCTAKGGAGTTCATDSACEDTLYCDSETHTCKVRQTAGATAICTSDRQCAENSYCGKDPANKDQTVCTKKPAKDEECSDKIPCETNLLCNTSATPNVCASGTDSKCKDDTNCQDGYYCNTTSKMCAQKVAVSGACETDSQCAGDAFCKEKKCTAPQAAADTATCSNDSQCDANSYCTTHPTEKNKKVCTARLADTKECKTDNSCQSGICLEGKCASGTDSKCEGDKQCKEGYFCGEDKMCAQITIGTPCSASRSCGNGNVCKTAQKKECKQQGNEGVTCSRDIECSGKLVCANKKCTDPEVKGIAGTPCELDAPSACKKETEYCDPVGAAGQGVCRKLCTLDGKKAGDIEANSCTSEEVCAQSRNPTWTIGYCKQKCDAEVDAKGGTAFFNSSCPNGQQTCAWLADVSKPESTYCSASGYLEKGETCIIRDVNDPKHGITRLPDPCKEGLTCVTPFDAELKQDGGVSTFNKGTCEPRCRLFDTDTEKAGANCADGEVCAPTSLAFNAPRLLSPSESGYCRSSALNEDPKKAKERFEDSFKDDKRTGVEKIACNSGNGNDLAPCWSGSICLSEMCTALCNPNAPIDKQCGNDKLREREKRTSRPQQYFTCRALTRSLGICEN